MKTVENVLEKRLRIIVAIDILQFDYLPGTSTIDAVFISCRIQEKYLSKQTKLNMCFVDLEKAFDSVPNKVMVLSMRKKGISEAFVRALMSLYTGARTKLKVGTHLSEEFEASVGVHQCSVLSPTLFAIVIDVDTNEMEEVALL